MPTDPSLLQGKYTLIIRRQDGSLFYHFRPDQNYGADQAAIRSYAQQVLTEAEGATIADAPHDTAVEGSDVLEQWAQDNKGTYTLFDGLDVQDNALVGKNGATYP